MADTWHVTGQEQTTARTDAGTFTEVVRVRFTVPDIGGTFFVDVPVAQYNAAHVKQLIDAYVSKLTATHAL